MELVHLEGNDVTLCINYGGDVVVGSRASDISCLTEIPKNFSESSPIEYFHHLRKIYCRVPGFLVETYHSECLKSPGR